MRIKCVLLLAIFHVAHGQDGAQAKALRQKIFETDDYDKKIRPVTDQTDPTEVYVSYFLLSINGLDEVTETLKTTGYLVVEWYDQYLSWNASEYGDLDLYFFPQDDVWKPDVALRNSVEKYKSLGVSTLNVQVQSNGYVMWYPFEVFQSTCAIDITYFPFDVQTCKLIFAAWSYTKDQIDMLGGSGGIDLEKYQTNSEWDMIDSSATVEEESDEAVVIFTLKIKRKPRYMILSVILPIIMLSVLNLFVFVLPCDSGEKASYAITVFLAFAVFLTIISSALPNNSESLSIFSVYIIILTVQSTLISMLALIVLRLRQFESPVPWFVASFVDIMFCQCCKRERSKIKPVFEQNAENGVLVNGDFHNQQNNDDQIKRVKTELFNVNAKEGNYEVTEKDNTYVCDWKRVANALDIFFFCFFALVTLVSSLACMLYASTGTA